MLELVYSCIGTLCIGKWQLVLHDGDAWSCNIFLTELEVNLEAKAFNRLTKYKRDNV